jgi:hypothetical protein
MFAKLRGATAYGLSIALLASIVGISLVASSAFAQGTPPPADAAPGAVGVSGFMLGGIDTTAASGYRLEMTELVWAPGGYVTRHFHPIAIVVCVQKGALGFAIQEGAATVTRGGAGETPETTEPLPLNTEVVLEPRDCIAFDEFAAHTIHTAWNASDGETVTWETDLLKIGEPFTTFVDDMGTPVP